MRFPRTLLLTLSTVAGPQRAANANHVSPRMSHAVCLGVCALLLDPVSLLASHPRSSDPSVKWETSATVRGELNLVFQKCSPEGTPVIPAINGANAEPVSRTTYTEFNNTPTGDYVRLAYKVAIRGDTPLSIPSFEVKTDRGIVRIPPAEFGESAPPLPTDVVTARVLPSSTTVWVGEVFPLTYSLSAIRRNFSKFETNPTWNASPLLAETWAKPTPSERTVNGETRLNVVYPSRAVMKAPGPVTLPIVTQTVRLQNGTSGWGLFATPRLEVKSVTSDRPVITARPLPTPAPADFSGAVGQFKLVSKIIPESPGVGEPVTWTFELSGTGNWLDLSRLPAREISSDFHAVQSAPKRTMPAEKVFDATFAEDVILIPTKPGVYVLSPVSFTYFDPKTGSYQTLSSPRHTLTVSPTSGGTASLVPATIDSTPPASSSRSVKVGGIPLKGAPLPANAALDLPLRNLEQVRNQDSPAQLLKLMEGEKKPATNTKGKDQ